MNSPGLRSAEMVMSEWLEEILTSVAVMMSIYRLGEG